MRLLKDGFEKTALEKSNPANKLRHLGDVSPVDKLSTFDLRSYARVIGKRNCRVSIRITPPKHPAGILLALPGMNQTLPMEQEMYRGPVGTLVLLLDELPLGVLGLSEDGEIIESNQAATRLLDGPLSKVLRQKLTEICGCSGPMEQSAEVVFGAGGIGQIRIILARAAHRAGFLAIVEQSAQIRLRTEVKALRSMLAVAAEAVPPREAAVRALKTISGSLAGCMLVLHEIDEETRSLVCVAQAGFSISLEGLAQPFSLDPAASTLGRAVAFCQPVHLPSLARSPFAAERALVKPDEKVALLAIPIRLAGRPSGVVTVFHPTGVLGDGEMRMIQGLADALGTLLERSRADAVMAAEVSARRSLMENLPDAVVEQGAGGVISMAAGRLKPILGRESEEVEGLSLDELVVEEERQKFLQLLREAPVGTPTTSEFLVLTPQSKRIPCEVSISCTGHGENMVWRAIFRDLSARRALEADVMRAREIATRRERLAAIGQLAAGVAHEINNPLSFVKSNLNTMTSYLDELSKRLVLPSVKDAPHSLGTTTNGDLTIEELVQEIREMAADSRAGLDRIAGIVQALKGMTRNRGEERVVFSPQKVFEEAVLIFRGAKQKCEVNLQIGNLPPISGSPGSLGQVILNLLENALDSMGGAGTILLEAREFEGKLRMVVKDTGSGIPPEISSRIFEPFFTTKENGGTGLGLYICHEIVKQMNGEISFRSSPGDTSFVVDFPLA